jgi:hypothetical protein
MAEITVKELLDERFEKCDHIIYKSVKFYEICAKDFLQFAMEDSKGGDLRCMVNALGNVKRAIECRVDTILYSYCLYKKSEAEKWPFPKKIEIIEQLGIIAPRILKKINRKRNELEHQYIEPTKDDVEDALDVATLFLAYTERLENKAKKGYGIRNNFEIELQVEKGIVELTDLRKKVTQKAKIDNDDGWIDFAKRLSGMELRP